METKRLNQVIAQLKTRVAELESQLDLVEMDQGFLREELTELRAWKEATARNRNTDHKWQVTVK